ncbi:MAG: hypothetical protein AUJ85_01795 [Elusimicrobia bacterium CG1_02_37_114]|nr:MAG: hypothetical protein AUJ85_01795 [Elusimicrobia bacterium CG1_02_37_114]PIV52586.1 MAG: hypothetical protein COS17_08315 [Elusimicrobia bacterium CG02_land_8_20_14_3_00_37_13]PIZ12841.1 MAG: hypothetical protein COY53_07930 [Elusimicrobia bacterium CG_4_10_14_0_8_um_filter_37_32]
MNYKIEIFHKDGVFDAEGEKVKSDIRDLGISGIKKVKTEQLYIINGNLTDKEIETVCKELLIDSVVQEYRIVDFQTITSHTQTESDIYSIEVFYKKGVTDAVGESTLKAIKDMGIENVNSVRTGRKYLLIGSLAESDLGKIATRILANTVVQEYKIS